MINKLEKVIIFPILLFIIFFTTCCSNKKLNTINRNNNKYNSLKLEESIKDLETEKETLKRSIRLLTPEIDATNVQPITNGNALKVKSEYKDWYFAEIERKVAAEPINEGWISKSNLGYLDDVIKYRRYQPKYHIG